MLRTGLSLALHRRLTNVQLLGRLLVIRAIRLDLLAKGQLPVADDLHQNLVSGSKTGGSQPLALQPDQRYDFILPKVADRVSVQSAGGSFWCVYVHLSSQDRVA